VILLLAFALILNIHTTSAASINGTSSLNGSVSTLASTNQVSLSSSSPSTNSNTTKLVSAAKDVTKPKIVKSDPVKNAVNVNTKKTIKITFSEAIKFGNKWIQVKTKNGKNVSFKVSINGKVLTITPTSLVNGGTYVWFVHTGSIKDLSGNNVSYYDGKFTTATSKKTVSAALVKYLKPTANCQSTNSKIKALAASLTKGKTSDYAKASSIFNWVRDHLSYSFYYNTKKGALGALSSRSANCADTAHLVVALERAAGIAARYNHGTCKFSSGNWYGHVWAQVYVNGKWYYADGTSKRNSFGVVKNWNTKSFTLHGIYASLPF
jgi:methionine-rich copper-binding protein CopC